MPGSTSLDWAHTLLILSICTIFNAMASEATFPYNANSTLSFRALHLIPTEFECCVFGLSITRFCNVQLLDHLFHSSQFDSCTMVKEMMLAIFHRNLYWSFAATVLVLSIENKNNLIESTTGLDACGRRWKNKMWGGGGLWNFPVCPPLRFSKVCFGYNHKLDMGTHIAILDTSTGTDFCQGS